MIWFPLKYPYFVGDIFCFNCRNVTVVEFDGGNETVQAIAQLVQELERQSDAECSERKYTEGRSYQVSM